jgi:hypothetical protein
MEQLGRILVVMGGALVLLGLFLMLGLKLPLNFHYQRGNLGFYFPLGASILISVLLTLVFALLNRR